MATYANDFDTNTKTYFNEISKFKPLTKIEEKKLCKRIKKNDSLAKEQLITSNLKFVVDVAKHYKGRGVSFPDLVAEGNMGLLKAVDKFDYKKDVKFISYAVWWVRQSIQEAIRKKNNTEELPSELEKNISEYSDDDLIEATTSNVFEDFDVKEDDETINNEMVIKELLHKLTPRERKIIEYRFGLNGHNEETLDEIGLKLKLTKERVRQIETKIFLKLRAFALEDDVLHRVYN